MARLGMDADAVEQAGRDLKARADSIASLQNTVDRLVNNLASVWDGQDAQQFVNQWWPQHRKNLAAVTAAITGLGQAALNNASEQRSVSSGNGASTSVGVAPGAPAPGGGSGPQPGTAPGPGGGSVWASGRSDADVQARYYEWAAGRFARGGESHLQCTSWANFRWNELGYDGEISGHGAAMAADAARQTGIALSSEPSLHAMASYGTGYGHVMIVEEVFPDGRIRISDMNVNADASEWSQFNDGTFRDDKIITPDRNGRYWSGKNGDQEIRFAAFPG